MGNLGTYQEMTKLAKMVGGPRSLAAVTAVAGYIILRPSEAAVRRIVRTIKKRNVPCATKGQVFLADASGKDSSGLTIQEGGEYRVLECDGEAVLIEVLGDSDSPYFVSSTFLASISDYPSADAEGPESS